MNRESDREMRNLLFLILLITSMSTFVTAGTDKPLSKSDQVFKQGHLSNLGAPGFNNEKVWHRLIAIAAKNEDIAIIDKIFSMGNSGVDASYATNYSNYLFELFNANPSFFLKNADRFYQHKWSPVLDWWINEIGDYSVEDLEKVTKKITTDRQPEQILAKELISAAKTKEMGISKKKGSVSIKRESERKD